MTIGSTERRIGGYLQRAAIWQNRFGAMDRAVLRNQWCRYRGDNGYFKLLRKPRISRSVSGSFDRKMWCAPGSLTTRAVAKSASTAFACLSVDALIAA
jgi:hypothetical protein